MGEEEHEGASVEELLIEACRRDNTELLGELLDGKSEAQITKLLNETTTVMGNHLYHEAASRGNYDVIDLLLDQPDFECDPINRLEGDTPLHSAIRWLNAEPPAQRSFGHALIEMMLEAGSNPRVKNKGGLTALQLVDPRNKDLRLLIQKHDYANQNAGDFVSVSVDGGSKKSGGAAAAAQDSDDDESDEDAEFSGSDEEERAEWERRRKAKKNNKR